MAKAVQVQVLSRAPIPKKFLHGQDAPCYVTAGRLMRARFLFYSTMTAAVAALCGGCAIADKQAHDEPEPAMRAMGQPVQPPAQASEEASDDAIGSEIRRLLNMDATSTAGIIVEVVDGNVTLRGTAPTPAASWRAEAAAHSVKGVKAVRNQIAVKAAPTTL
jgi:hyperosmotically inducible periplasmic protein